jgi:hypothetical protein
LLWGNHKTMSTSRWALANLLSAWRWRCSRH